MITQLLMVKILLKKFLVSLTALLLPTSANAELPNWLHDLSAATSVESRSLDHRREITCFALAVYYEARGESLRGQRAVASVVANRMRNSRYEGSACDVIFQPHQFSFIRRAPLNPSGTSWAQALSIGREFADRQAGEVPFLSFSAERGLRGTRIGKHVFR